MLKVYIYWTNRPADTRRACGANSSYTFAPLQLISIHVDSCVCVCFVVGGARQRFVRVLCVCECGGERVIRNAVQYLDFVVHSRRYTRNAVNVCARECFCVHDEHLKIVCVACV